MEKFVQKIHPPRGFSMGMRELWHYRELFYFFTWRDIKVRYKQTYLGILWAILQPLGLMLLFTLIFSKSWKIDSAPIYYPLFVLSGLIIWNLFNAAVSHAAESMIQHSSMIKRIYFPRLIIPGSAVLVAFIDFLVGLLLFVAFCFFYDQPVLWSAFIYFPAGIGVVLLAALGTGIFLSALNIKFRDFRYTISFGLQFLFFASQVIYPLQQIADDRVKYLLALNPVNAAIELFRAPLNGGVIDWEVVGIGTATALVLFLVGLFYFRKTEAQFADIS
jgi:lipopolysaccharide transport system permease protein